MSAMRPTEYKIYKVTIFNARGLVEGRMELAAEDRRRAEDAGIFWAKQRGMTGYHVSVMRKITKGTPQTVLVITG